MKTEEIFQQNNVFLTNNWKHKKIDRDGTERVRVGPSGRSAVGQFFRRAIFQKNRIREFFEKCFKEDGTERVGRVGTERVGRVGNPLGRQSLL